MECTSPHYRAIWKYLAHYAEGIINCPCCHTLCCRTKIYQYNILLLIPVTTTTQVNKGSSYVGTLSPSSYSYKLHTVLTGDMSHCAVAQECRKSHSWNLNTLCISKDFMTRNWKWKPNQRKWATLVVELLPHRSPGLILTAIADYMFSLWPCGFTPDAPVSSHIPQACRFVS